MQDIFNNIDAKKLIDDLNMLEKPLNKQRKLSVFVIILAVLISPIFIIAAIGQYASEGSLTNTIKMVIFVIIVLFCVFTYATKFKPIRNLVAKANEDYKMNNLATVYVHICEIKTDALNNFFNLLKTDVRAEIYKIMVIRTVEGKEFCCNKIPETTTNINISAEITYYASTGIVKSITVL